MKDTERRLTHFATLEDARGVLRSPIRLAVVTDLHNGPFEDLLPLMEGVDAILIVGDMVRRYSDGYDQALRFLQAAPDIAPTYYSLGNHEIRLASREAYMRGVAETRVTLLDNRVVRLRDDIALAGLTSTRQTKPDEARALVDALAREEGFRLLMSHHPEDYPRYIRGKGIDLTLSGHAHGGQIQIGGRGLYAPGQGLLPKWTDGFYDHNRLLVSRGLTNTNPVPRWGNPCELILLTLVEKDALRAG